MQCDEAPWYAFRAPVLVVNDPDDHCINIHYLIIISDKYRCSLEHRESTVPSKRRAYFEAIMNDHVHGEVLIQAALAQVVLQE